VQELILRRMVAQMQPSLTPFIFLRLDWHRQYATKTTP
jgi:hypothetical protein